MSLVELVEHLPLIIGLIGYFVLHSLLASQRIKRFVRHRWPVCLPAYRLFYNLQSLILLLPLIWLAWSNPGNTLWQWTGYWAWLMNGLALLALVGFLYSFKVYDGGHFLGLTQWRQRSRQTLDQDSLRLSSLHRYVRHPWYCFGLVILWTRDMTVANLILFSLITVYLVMGSRLEENKLIDQYGEAYREYRRRVAGLLPLPWRTLSRAEAEALQRKALESGVKNRTWD